MLNVHITADGETFDALALRYYNDEKMASVIIQANPDFCDVLIFGAGDSIIIPEISTAARPETLPPWRREA